MLTVVSISLLWLLIVSETIKNKFINEIAFALETTEKHWALVFDLFHKLGDL